MNETYNEASPAMSRYSMSNATRPVVVVDSPSKEKGNGFLSFLARFSGRRASLPHLPPVPPINTNHSSNDTVNTPITPTLKSPLSFSRPNVLIPTQNSPDAPPLFVAYSQAIKAAALAALTVPSDTILRRNLELKAKSEKDKRGRFIQRGRAGSRTEMEWTQKMFLLVPGMLLQYNADGAVDRLPEKALQLTANSVAFASDVIPGKPYVLQVLQNANADGSPIYEDKEKRGTLFAKFSSKHSAKHSAVSCLLVFDSSKEMDSWMGFIRAEVQKLAGTYVPEPEPARPIPRALSRRITIRREEDDIFDPEVDSRRYSRLSRASRPSLDTGRSFTTAISGEQLALERLRGGSSRVSIQSNGQVTIPTVSPETSPERYSIRKEPNGLRNDPNRRRSMNALSSSVRSRSSLDLKPSPRPLSSVDVDRAIYIPITRTPSPSTSLSRRTSIHNKRYSGVGLGIPTPPLTARSFVSVNGGFSVDANASNTTQNLPQRRSSLYKPPQEDDIIPDLPSSPKSSKQYTLNIPRAHYPYRQRPSSMVDSATDVTTIPSSPSTSQAGFATPQTRTTRSQSHSHSLQRRSMGTLAGHSTAGYGIGPPSHPPPQIPLPKLPGNLNEPRSLRQGYHSAGPARTPKLGNRHSFHGVRSDGSRYL